MNILNIYLAAQYERKDEMRTVRDRLEAMGYKVTSRWIDQLDQDEGLGHEILTADPTRGRPYAYKDIEDIDACELFILFTSGTGGGRGGYHTEFGYALARAKEIILVGPRENVFHTMLIVTRFETTEQLLRWVACGS